LERVAAVIPARWGSQRFPGKVLAPICGKPMVQWVHERARSARRVDEVLVATDDERVADCVRGFGGRVVLTSSEHPTGTDRIAEALRSTDGGSDATLVLNVQADEPLVPPAVLDRLVDVMRAHPDCEMATVGVPMDPADPDFADPDVVKAVVSDAGRALYFSRAPVPFARGGWPAGQRPYRHWGIYAFRRDYLERFVSLPQSSLEKLESLEQLRALEDGARILLVAAEEKTVGVDRPDDVNRAEALMRAQGIAA
jgi:3-deoxy-manno-octulosonate cytidylyltransferase (CMP-KDO synthetase)